MWKTSLASPGSAPGGEDGEVLLRVELVFFGKMCLARFRDLGFVSRSFETCLGFWKCFFVCKLDRLPLALVGNCCSRILKANPSC